MNLLCFQASFPARASTRPSFVTTPLSQSSLHGAAIPRTTRVQPLHVSPRTPTVARLAVALPAVDPKIFFIVFKAVIKLLTTIGLGVVASKQKLLDAATLKALSKTVFNIFLPALLLTNIARTLSLQSPGPLLILPLISMSQAFVGLLLGFLGSKLLKLNPTESRMYTVCTGFGNSAALPLLFATSLFEGTPHLAPTVSAIGFFLVGWIGLFWSIGYTILAGIPSSGADAPTKKDKGSLVANLIKRALSPPLIASLLGLFIGLSPYRQSFVTTPLFNALQTLGLGYAPAAVLILAGSLARKVETKEKFSLSKMAAGICATRFMLLPLYSIMILRLAPGLFKTPYVILAMLLEAIMPSAQNSTLILNLENRPDAASNIAKVLLVVYTLGVLPISAGLTVFLPLAKLVNF